LNGDTNLADFVSRRCRGAVLRIGFAEQSDWRITKVRTDERGVNFFVTAPNANYSGDYRVNLLGRHQATNAALAIAMGAELGLSAEEIRRGLVSCQPPKMRLQIFESNGVRILNDAYNANADSMLAALQTLTDFPCAGRRIAVLGDMAELGEHSVEAHCEIGRRTAELGVSQLVTVGKMASLTARAARHAGLRDVTECNDVAEAMVALKQLAREGDVILVKASRVTGLERLSESLT
jgi:UDP-N-acetylmuramoyl-tripeptide--D-alanyl-D-alanine ligase